MLQQLDSWWSIDHSSNFKNVTHCVFEHTIDDSLNVIFPHVCHLTFVYLRVYGIVKVHQRGIYAFTVYQSLRVCFVTMHCMNDLLSHIHLAYIDCMLSFGRHYIGIKVHLFI